MGVFYVFIGKKVSFFYITAFTLKSCMTCLNFLGLNVRISKYSQSIVFCSTGETSLPSLYIMTYLSAGIVPILYTLMSELFPTEIRTQAIGITEALYLASEGVGVKLFPEMKNSMGLCGVCLLYASMGYLNVLWGGLTIPDNRGTYSTKS